MKKEFIDLLNTDLQFIKGVGPKVAARFEDVIGGRRVLDFLLHKPSYVRARDVMDSVTDATPGDTITIALQVKSHRVGRSFRGRRSPSQVVCSDKMGNTVTIQFFNVNFLDYWLAKLPIGAWRIVSGKLERGTRAIINHPEFIEDPEHADKIPKLQAIYPAGEGLTQKTFASVRDQIFAAIQSHVDAETNDQAREFFDALHHVHFPTCPDDLGANSVY
ncbi:MAG: hypothetical protein K2M34_00975, partial [Alphaproteobacteria bacterium]|nr:hypothetical protein [Alphaproteobacteria bacterium]